MKNYADLILYKTNIKPETILEIGSRDGDDANILKTIFNIKNENVYVVEPNPPQQEIIVKNYPEFVLIRNAIYNKEEELAFYACTDPGISSLLNRQDNYYEKVQTNIIKVKTITGERLLNDINKDIDLCKIDVEGATFQVLESFGDSLSKIKSMHIECEHLSVWREQKLYHHVKKYLEKNNFIEIYCTFDGRGIVPKQSDSIWVYKHFLK